MKKVIFLAALGFAAGALAQAVEKKAEAPQPEAVKTAVQPEALKAGEPAQAQLPRSAGKQHLRRSEDARHCLERPGNLEIIKCAEEYL